MYHKENFEKYREEAFIELDELNSKVSGFKMKETSEKNSKKENNMKMVKTLIGIYEWPIAENEVNIVIEAQFSTVLVLVADKVYGVDDIVAITLKNRLGVAILESVNNSVYLP